MVVSSEPESNRILIVDDDTEICVALSRTLRRLGYVVSVAYDGEAGFELATSEKPHVVLTDIRMPQMDGHTFLRRLETHDPNLPVIVMSAHGTMDDVVDVLRHGAVDYLKKPWTPSELIAAVVRALDIGEQRTANARASARAPVNSARSDAPAGVRTPSSPARPDPVLSGIRSQLERGEITLPAVPSVVRELRSVVSKADTTLDTISTLIERDPRVAAQVLQLAKSAQSAGFARGNDVRGAIARIGIKQIHSIVETIFLHGCYPIREPRLAPLQRRIWRFSVARAISMRALADLSPNFRFDAETAYTSGLLADVGASFLLWVHSERVVAGNKKLPANLAEYAATLAVEHAQVGQDILQRWGLDSVVCTLAAVHHDDAPTAPVNPYWALGIVGSELANQLTPDDDVTRECPLRAELVDRCQAELQISSLLLRKLTQQLHLEFKVITSSLQ